MAQAKAKKTNSTASRKTTNKRKDTSKKGLLIAIIAIALVAALGVTYAFFTTTDTGKQTNTITAGTLTLTLDDETAQGINISGKNAIPLTEETAKKEYTPYEFQVTNSGDVDAVYTLTLVDEAFEGEKMADEKIRYSISAIPVEDGVEKTEVETKDLLSALTDRKIATDVSIKAGDSVKYKLYLWIDQDAGNEVAGQKFSAKVELKGEQLLK